MTIQLISCDAQRPDKRAIAKAIEEHTDTDSNLAREFTDYLLEGSPVDVEISSNESSAFRAFRKLDIEYEILA
ncbi:MAG: hypothetical protein ACI85O_003113 [Saprospiraceae bacterium]|jgi:hypothetical protein